jgi:branched-chain amino acid transport system permease protein
VVAIPLSALVALVSLRARHMFFGLITLAIGQVGFVFVSRNYSLTGGDDGLTGVVVPEWLDNDVSRHFLALAVFVIVGLLLLRVLASPFGAMLSAVRDNPNRVASLGANPKVFEFAAMLLAGCLGTVFGALWAYTQGSVEPSVVSWVTSAMLLMMVALGGRSLFIGPAIGAIVLELSRTYVQARSSNGDLVVGSIVIACAIFFPEGVGVALRDAVQRAKGRRGARADQRRTEGGAIQATENVA